MVLQLLSAYYEQQDERLLNDKRTRKAAGLQVERRMEKRSIFTLLGHLEYRRTYYHLNDGGYCHPTDAIAGVTPNQKVTTGVSLALVKASASMSYDKSCHKIRSSRVKPFPARERKVVPVLHVDADEDHVSLQNGSNAIVPLVSVYEAVMHTNGRGMCQNIVHYSEFGMKTEQLWENVLTDLERRYDLKHTKIYLHGDGAAWVKQGLEWLPKSVFVLDRYHKNKALRKLVSGIEAKSGSQYKHLVQKALSCGNEQALRRVLDRLEERFPERQETVSEAGTYLCNNLEGIAIYHRDLEASRGGATEPHVSHILSARLSSRPMGWSEKTLQRLAPLLAGGTDRVTLEERQEKDSLPQECVSSVWCRPKSRTVPFSLGLPHPDTAVSLPGRTGKVTALSRALRSF